MLYIVIISDSLPQEGNYNVTRSLLKRFPYYPSSATHVSTATCNKKGRRTSGQIQREEKEGGRKGVERRGNISRERIFVSDWKSRAHKIVIYECARFAPLVHRLARWTAFNCGSNGSNRLAEDKTRFVINILFECFLSPWHFEIYRIISAPRPERAARCDAL